MRGDAFFAEVSKRPPFTKLHPRIGAFLKQYFAKEKVIRFGERFVINTNFPPYPGPAFDQLTEQFQQLGDAAARRLYSVTLAVTNRCRFNCWHCYNAGRSQVDIPLPVLKNLAAQLQDLGAVMITLTGGEPLLRDDLPEIARAFDERSCLVLGTTGDGLTRERARALRESGVFAVGISLDSDRAEEHDRSRGRPGAFGIALRGLEAARESGLYPYVVSVATREFLQRDRLLPFLRYAAGAGALEVHLLEPSATGKLAGQQGVLLNGAERRRLFDYQAEIAEREDLPILSAFAYLESPDAFGCGAGLTHMYIDGSGEVCPCNLVPLSFGNLTQQPFGQILDRMGRHFCRPRPSCVGRQLLKRFPATAAPAGPEASETICEEHLPRAHVLPVFFQISDEVKGDEVGVTELKAAYDRVHSDYDEFWLVEAAKPVDELVQKLCWEGGEEVFEAGCGTGYATALLARRAVRVVAVDLSREMLLEAQQRLRARAINNVSFAAGDALRALRAEGRFDVVFSSWALGYIPLGRFFNAAAQALSEGGQLAFLVHKENSPREPLEIFAELVAEEPEALLKRVAFDFPRDAKHVRGLIEAAGFQIRDLREGHIVFQYENADEVLDHLLQSGAGTAFYDALDRKRRGALTCRFLEKLTQRRKPGEKFDVRHDYVACVATRI